MFRNAKKWIIISILILIFLFVGFVILSFWLKTKDFKSFDLENLKRQELIIQSIGFRKFLLSGTDGQGSAYTDELQIYLVSGKATVSFVDIDNLSINENDTSKVDKVLRLNYAISDKAKPFEVDVIMDENDIYKVATFESKEVSLFGYSIDFVKPDMSQAERVEETKKSLKKEFEDQLGIDVTKPKELEKSDLYQTFLKRLEEIITKMSDFESVEIQFISK